MLEKFFFGLLRISCSLMMRASVLIFLFSPCRASDSPSTLLDFDPVKSDTPVQWY